jgi:hypothetical protein
MQAGLKSVLAATRFRGPGVGPLDVGVLGRVMVSRPFLKLATTLLPSTVTGSRTLRANIP